MRLFKAGLCPKVALPVQNPVWTLGEFGVAVSIGGCATLKMSERPCKSLVFLASRGKQLNNHLFKCFKCFAGSVEFGRGAYFLCVLS
jgi:hypothetical protein